ncbi:unnamed protein product, partial [Porites evermanni]
MQIQPSHQLSRHLLASGAAPMMKLDKTLCNKAQEFVNKLKSSGQSAPSLQGKNVISESFCSTNGGNSMEQILTRWYDEVCKYKFNNGGTAGGP